MDMFDFPENNIDILYKEVLDLREEIYSYPAKSLLLFLTYLIFRNLPGIVIR